MTMAPPRQRGRVGRVAGGRRPATRDPRPRAKSATRDTRPRATRAARPGPGHSASTIIVELNYAIATALASSMHLLCTAVCNTLYAKIWSVTSYEPHVICMGSPAQFGHCLLLELKHIRSSVRSQDTTPRRAPRNCCACCVQVSQPVMAQPRGLSLALVVPLHVLIIP